MADEQNADWKRRMGMVIPLGEDSDSDGDVRSDVLPGAVSPLEVVIRTKDSQGHTVEAVFPVCHKDDSEAIQVVESYNVTEVLSGMSYTPVRSDKDLVETRLEISLRLLRDENGRLYSITTSDVESEDTPLLSDMDLPGMWSQSDFSGGESDVRRE